MLVSFCKPLTNFSKTYATSTLKNVPTKIYQPLSRPLMKPDEALQQIIPKGPSHNPARMGMKYFRSLSKSKGILK